MAAVTAYQKTTIPRTISPDAAEAMSFRSSDIADGDDLARVMQEISQIIGGCATVLTLHPSGGQLPCLLFASSPAATPQWQSLAIELASAFIAETSASHSWRKGIDGLGADVLLIAVEPIPGHSQLVISIFFKGLTLQTRTKAEQVYLQRRPFAIGYFRLWQANRVSSKRCAALASALHQTDTGVIMLGRGGKIVFANDAAEALLSRNDALRRRNGFISAPKMTEDLSLRVAIDHLEAANASRDTIAEKSAPVLALRRSAGPPLIVSLVAADAPAIEPDDVAVILYAVDPQLSTTRMLAPVCRLYRLSPAETELVCHLAQGKALTHVAETMHIKEQTARSYLKQIFLKTATNRQTELVVLMLSSLVRMKDSVVQEALSLSLRDKRSPFFDDSRRE